ncbi:diguanylate cyclase (GGDEF)-like protein [Peribacillus deserti]|uniref:Diguanylate cyclase (GGDEF)-like protein n=1 Tax=Peribacillus deserti TaxID=673318 RepID=A0ABS2QGV8_9BACI|nr:sensor domain-containing diguanylate cyclase [Peribacillus deserti]MBM7691939.1 diguanylate cyclase (GGDEF)-like protein [Peribacillus deserti]
MQVPKRKRMIIWLLWFLLIPASFSLVYAAFPPQVTGREIDVIAFLILMSIVSCIPIMINKIPVIASQGVSLAVFLIFGLVTELVLTQIATMVMLINLKVRGESIYRYPLNSLMFFFISLGSAVTFYLFGGNHQPDFETIGGFLPITAYEAAAFILNQIFLSCILFFVFEDRKIFGISDFIWDAVTSAAVAFPIGLALYMLYEELGIVSILLAGIPYICLTAVLKLYNSTGKMNRALQKTSDIGRQITGILNVDKVLDIFLQKISDLIPIDYAFVYEFQANELVLICSLESEDSKNDSSLTLKPYNGVSSRVYKSGRSLILNSRSQSNKLETSYVPTAVESILSVPIMRKNKPCGVITLASNQEKAFEKYHLTLVDILSSHLFVAIENARLHEETKKNSEICALTKVYNYRYFEELLHKEYDRIALREIQNLSLILLDLDHFKSVNDTYGHQSGNDILYQMARRLQEIIGSNGTVARYGGEEFVILLPEYVKSEAYVLAESIRENIEMKPFDLHSDLNDIRTKLEVYITASIGVASAPQDSEDPLSLVRHADRAMYTGAKKAGRNRVAEYVK